MWRHPYKLCVALHAAFVTASCEYGRVQHTCIHHSFSTHCLQEKKQLVFEGTVGKDAEALGRLTEDDLRFLFG